MCASEAAFAALAYLLSEDTGSRNNGGLYSAVAEFIASRDLDCTLTGLGIPDRFIEQGTPAELYADCGYDTAGILEAILK